MPVIRQPNSSNVAEWPGLNAGILRQPNSSNVRMGRTLGVAIEAGGNWYVSQIWNAFFTMLLTSNVY